MNMSAIDVKYVSPQSLKARLDSGEEFQLFDIREEEELLECDIDFEHVPMADIVMDESRFHAGSDVVVACRTGRRALAVVMTLERKFSLENLYVLEGGVVAWMES